MTQKTTPDFESLIKEYQNQLSDLGYRARNINYLNILPQIPKKPTSSTLSGFQKRLSNWKKGLIQLEGERLREITLNDPHLLSNYIKR